ncbi:hypothetical protein LTR86_005078 [Recurvomyces mirabilis]|nr:hypothetical protein LTR86_005078 [Recurvomyces mirabilis]
MNSYLLNRQLGTISPQALARAQNQRLLESLQASPKVQFQRPESRGNHGNIAHATGVTSIAIDRFEGRYLLSGGADSSVSVWDLEATQASHDGSLIHTPLATALRTSTTESLGITHVSFYPFDSLAFLTSGYDRTLKIFSSETLQASGTFDLGSTIYSHATSNVASHLLIACASQHPAVRLVDLQSGSSTHSLAGHAGSVLSVSWHPKNEHILASGATDGTCRLWDIRRSASSLGVLDFDDSVGLGGYDANGTGARRRERGKAHNGAVNGITWSEDGRFMVTMGHDERMRVWQMNTGGNTLVNFGPSLKNTLTTTLTPLIPPAYLSAPGTDTIYYPNPGEILALDLHNGRLLKKLRAPASQKPQSGRSMGNLSTRITSMAWRAHTVELYSAHGDGTIRAWCPWTDDDDVGDGEGVEDDDQHREDDETAERKRKRDELDHIVQDLTKKRVTYS